MRVLYLDIDSLRPDHLGCYGYCRDTSPNIDRVAAGAVRFTNCYTPDAPCLPSRTAMFSGRFGIHTGVVNHGGTAADPLPVGRPREFMSSLWNTAWPALIARQGLYPCCVSPFPQRHSAFHVLAGFREWHNAGKNGTETADEIFPAARDWLEKNANGENWFLHVNFWDPHTPYQAPESFGNPFAGEPLDDWLTAELLAEQYASYGPHSAHDPPLQGTGRFPRMPDEIATLDDYRRWIDGYDCGVRYADEHVGRLLNVLADQGVLDETAIIVSADHGENLGEHNVYGDHQTADYCTSRIPMIVNWPGVAPRADDRLLYNVDLAAAVVEKLGGAVPGTGRGWSSALPDGMLPWDGHAALVQLDGADPTCRRDSLVVSQCAWACQRAVRWDRWLLIRTYHAGWKAFRPVQLHDVVDDPHMTVDRTSDRPDLVNHGLAILEGWVADQMAVSRHQFDPLWNVMREGGPLHTRNRKRNAGYLKRLRETGRAHHAEHLEAVYGDQGAAE